MERREQLALLSSIGGNLPFEEIVKRVTGGHLKASDVKVLQINVGRLCNLSCRHCHLEAGMQNTESMPGHVFEKCLEVIQRYNIQTADITGGAPELNPNLEWFIERVCGPGMRVMVRSNLALLGDHNYGALAGFFAGHKVEIVASLPNYREELSDRQRGAGVFKKIIGSMRMLNSLGYGHEGSGLVLDIVHNPVGAFLPGTQKSLEHEYRQHLINEHGVVFNNLFCITNMPVGRYLEYLVRSGNYEEYFNGLCAAFNPGAMSNVMCTNTVSVGWDGSLYDCDFNQALGIKIDHGAPDRINDFDIDALANRRIAIHNHCYGCCAGAGSSCQGATS